MANNYFDFLSSSAPAEEKPAPSNNSNSVNVTVRVDADAFLLCDGEYLEIQLSAGKMEKVQLPAGQHLLQFMSVEYPDIIVEKEVDFPDAGKSYLVIIKELSTFVAPKKERSSNEAAERERVATETAKRIEAEQKRQERNQWLESIDFVDKYINHPIDSTIKSEYDVVELSRLVDNEIIPAVNLGVHSAEFVYSQILRYGSSGITDEEQSMSLLKKAAEGGFARAQNTYGNAFLFADRGLTRDYNEAFKWYVKAAAQNFALAEEHLGDCYWNGWGVDQNCSEAIKWYTKAAEQGRARSQIIVGDYYYDYHDEEGYSKAFKWYKKAAEQGISKAQVYLGICYLNGFGVDEDHSEAFKWFKKAAEQGNSDAQEKMGVCYEYGKGVGQDDSEAFKWFKKAAEQGCENAQISLGECYEEGRGVNVDYLEAAKWYLKAGPSGGVFRGFRGIEYFKERAKDSVERQDALRKLGESW